MTILLSGKVTLCAELVNSHERHWSHVNYEIDKVTD